MFNKSQKALGTVKQPLGKQKIPPYFMCPLTLELMEDPTISQCGHMFEKEAIVRWLRDGANKQSCPLCQKKIQETTLAPCFPLKAAIADFRSQSGEGALDASSSSIKPNVLSTVSQKMRDMKLFKGDAKDEAVSGAPQTQRRPKPSPQSAAAKDSLGSVNALDQESPTIKRQVGKEQAKPKSSSKVGRVWSRLTPMLDTHGEIEINKDEFVFGRADSCDIKFTASEISNIHCSIYRVQRESGIDFDYFVEDRSTNGTFVNGHRVGKGLIASLMDQDEVSMGEKFTSKTVPKLASFIDWVFANIELTSERRADIERSKGIKSFYDLIELDDSGLRNQGIKSEYVRSKLLNATRNWMDKYRFPAFRFELVKKTTAGPSGRDRQVASDSGSNSNMDASEVGFEPTTYSEKSVSGVACLYVRRLRGSRGTVVVNVRTNEKGTAKLGSHFQHFDQKVTIPDGENEAVVEYYWRSDVKITGPTTISFEAKMITGKAFIGHNNTAVLIIEAPSKPKPKKSNPEPSKAKSGRLRRLENEMTEEERQEQENQDMLALMMESFPTLESTEIMKIIKEERLQMGSIDDRGLFQDLVVIKLTNLARGNALDLNYSNIRMTRTSQDQPDEEAEAPFNDVSFSQPTFGLGTQQQPTRSQPLSPGRQQPQQQQQDQLPPMTVDVSQPNINKIYQTILRSELQGFLLMASISLIRKFFSIQGVDNNVAHIQSPLVETAVALADAFMRSMVEMPCLQKGQTPAEDVYEFDRVVEQFKKYVYTNGSDLRTKAVGLAPEVKAQGYRYEVSFQKSAHHVKMENNHAVIEDLNTFANTNSAQTSFYGVFDGHGGYLISEYLSLHLANNIARNPSFTRNIGEAIRIGFKSTDEDILRKMKRDALRGGSTAAVAILKENVINVAWVGDARCIIFRKMNDSLVAFPITTEHHPQGAEKTRIIKMGGFVDHVAGKWRVNGRLAVSRSFGDDNLKPVVSAEPDQAKFSLMGDEVFMLLSCDGLYDVMEYSDVAEYLDDLLKQEFSLAEIAQNLVQEGVSRGSTDDITVMLVDLSRKFL